jgi:hypothetical protein
LTHTVVLADFVEGLLDFGLGVWINDLADLVDVQVHVLGGGGLADGWAVILVFFHELLE